MITEQPYPQTRLGRIQGSVTSVSLFGQLSINLTPLCPHEILKLRIGLPIHVIETALLHYIVEKAGEATVCKAIS